MRRRTLLAAASLVLAGCGQRTASNDRSRESTTVGSGDDTSSVTATQTDAATQTVESASLSVKTFSVPGLVEIETSFSATVAVSNEGERAGRFESAISKKLGAGDWQDTSTTASFDVPPGGTVTKSYEMAPAAFKRPASYRLDATETVARTTFVGRDMPWGTSYPLPNGIVLTVSTPAFSAEYTYPTGDGTRTADPSPGEKWAVYAVRAKNAGDEPVACPLMADVVLQRDDDEFRGDPLGGENEAQYRGKTLDPGAVSEGEIPADVPTDLTIDDLRVDYDRTFPGGTVDLSWGTDQGT